MNELKKLVSAADTKNPYENIETFIKKEEYKNFKPLIKVKGLTHYFINFNKKKVIYENLDFEIYNNEIVALLGPNGAGKTLTTSTLCGIFKQKSGTIEYCFPYEKKPYKELAVQFQDLQFPSSLTPADLIKFSLKIENIDHLDEDIISAIKTFQIDKIMNVKISKLSGGQQQRLNVLIALLGRPRILFLDEFTTGLDIAIKNKIKNFILKYAKKNKLTIVLISHDVECIKEMANRIIILADKRILIDSLKKDIETKFGSIEKMLSKYILA